MMDSSTRKPRTLVLCFDGTSNEYDEDNTNVVKLFALLKKDATDEQLCYYQSGVGTWFQPGVVSPLFNWGAKILDLAFAWYMDAHVLEGYKFLMQNYRAGDKICIFGFSRGAYTARALAGFLYKCGLLPRDNDSQMPFAYKLYKRTDTAGLQLCAGFKQTYCRNITVEFVGVWDTVASVGVLAGRTLPFTNANRGIKTFRHALSLDEHRAKFRPNFYHRPVHTEALAAEERAQEEAVEKGVVEALDEFDKASSSSAAGSIDKKKRFSGRSVPFRKKTVERKATGKSFAPELEDEIIPADVLEVWFSGCHGDVGGGSIPNSAFESLANISLRWMVREVIASRCGVLFDPASLARARIDISPERTPHEMEMDDKDSLEPIDDELVKTKMWWVLEILPLHFTWQDADGNWHTDFGCHMGRGRRIVDPHPNFHVTVQKRMKSALKYKPKAAWTAGTEVYVH